MTWVIAVANQKGGVGKTTSVVNLAAVLAKHHGLRTLVVDMDPQGHVSLSYELRVSSTGETIASALMGLRGMGEVTYRVLDCDLYVSPSNEDLAAVEEHLSRQPGREAVLRSALEPELPRYDVVIIDTPPSLGVLTFNAVYAADYVLVPIQPRLFSIEGLRRLYHILELMRSRLGRGVEVLGHFLTMVDNRYKITHEVREDLRGRLGERLMRSEIPLSVRVEEGHFYRRPCVLYAPDSQPARAYMDLASEALSRLRGGEPPRSTETIGIAGGGADL